MEKERKDKGTAKKPFYKKWWFWVIVVVVLVGIIGSSGAADDDTIDTSSTATETNKTSETTDNATTQEKTESETSVEADSETTESTSTKDILRNAIVSVVGEERLETFNYVPGNNFSLIKFRGSQNQPTNSMTIKSMYLDMFNILKKIQSTIDTDVDFNVVYPLQDKYGNVSDVIVIKATYTNDTIKKINFENVVFENIPSLADEWWNHNALNN